MSRLYDYEENYKFQEYKMHIEDEIEKQRVSALSKLAHVVPDFKYVDVIGRIIASGALENNPDAVKLTKDMNIDKLDMLAILEDYDSFKCQYERDAKLRHEDEIYYNNEIMYM